MSSQLTLRATLGDVAGLESPDAKADKELHHILSWSQKAAPPPSSPLIDAPLSHRKERRLWGCGQKSRRTKHVGAMHVSAPRLHRLQYAG